MGLRFLSAYDSVVIVIVQIRFYMYHVYDAPVFFAFSKLYPNEGGLSLRSNQRRIPDTDKIKNTHPIQIHEELRDKKSGTSVAIAT